nr:hypothetical protein [Tanacetum cinerariifolium]
RQPGHLRAAAGGPHHAPRAGQCPPAHPAVGAGRGGGAAAGTAGTDRLAVPPHQAHGGAAARH